MYEDQTQKLILSRMLSKVSDDLDKREGSIIHDACAPASIEVMLLYAMCDYFLTNTFGDTAERSFLIERAKERGLTPHAATYAVVKAGFTPESLEIPIGTRFSYDDLNYVVLEKVTAGVYLMRCETAGVVGNVPAGTLLPIDYIAGLQTAELTEVTIPGEDAEDTEVFRARYLASFDSQAYGGNIADYREKVNAIEGIGGVKVYLVWNGGGTVKVVFMTSEFEPPTAEFISSTQNLIDPEGHQGEGVGIAPIGHVVTVAGAINSAIDIRLHLTYAAGSFEDYRESIEKVIDDYFKALNATWQNTQIATTDQVSNAGLVVRISQLETRILAISGITDIEHTTLNGVEENLTLGVDALAVRGSVTDGT